MLDAVPHNNQVKSATRIIYKCNCICDYDIVIKVVKIVSINVRLVYLNGSQVARKAMFFCFASCDSRIFALPWPNVADAAGLEQIE